MHQRPARRASRARNAAIGFGSRIHDGRLGAGGIVDGAPGDQHVLGQRQHHRPGRPDCATLKRVRDVFGNAVGAIDLRDPFGDAAVHAPVVDFLERLAIAKSLPTWPTNTIIGDESCCAVWMPTAALDAPGPRVTNAMPGPAGQLAVRFGHVRRAAFLAADDKPQLFAHIVQASSTGEIAFAGNAKSQIGALSKKVRDQNLAAGAWRGHERRHSRVPGHRMAIPGRDASLSYRAPAVIGLYNHATPGRPGQKRLPQ